jgi:uncharacterized membrane protein
MGMRVILFVGGVVSSLVFHNVVLAQTLNEVPTLLLIGIVVLAVVKPF